MSKEEKKRLNALGGEILRESGLNFEKSKDYDWIIEQECDLERIPYVGYASYYLVEERERALNAKVYQRLLDIDSMLGTKASDQLYTCLESTTRLDIIKV